MALGLDLNFAADIFFHQTGYSIFTLRQASRRSWRIGQRRNVVVKFLHYAGTMQETCLRLMGKKLLVSLAMEGKFEAEGLATDQGDDLLMAMARELVTEQRIGEAADVIWRRIQQQNESLGHRDPVVLEAESEVESASEQHVIVPGHQALSSDVRQLSLFGG